MAGNQTNNGKAFEYACLKAICDTFGREAREDAVTVEDSPQLRTARNHYAEMSAEKRRAMDAAAKAAIRVITRLEPQLHAEANAPLILAIQTDAQGMSGDVRDVICIRRRNRWQIGLSCKHNHHAVKHSRLSGSIDFGAEWFGYPAPPTISAPFARCSTTSTISARRVAPRGRRRCGIPDQTRRRRITSRFWMPLWTSCKGFRSGTGTSRRS